jgi:Tfp pilus assembly protein PilF
MNSIQEILLSEMTQAKSYIDRLFHALVELSDGHNHPKIREAASDLTEDLEKLVRELLLKDQFTPASLIHRNNLKSARTNFKLITNLVESFIAFGADKKELAITTAKIINTIYSHAHRIHLLTQKIASLDVQPPRIGMIKEVTKEAETISKPAEVRKVGPFTVLEGGRVDEIEEEEELDEVPAPKLYQLDIEELLYSTDNKTTSLLGLEGKREEKYEQFLAEGHKHAYKKNYEDALESFEKALTYRENAEIITLIAWVHSLLGENEKSKNLCIKAISLDPDYGPPYNDLGTLLLNEGQLEEAVKWFELAKKAPKYQNKEYPYINAGRAYMMSQNYEKAMAEFEIALTLCPENEDLRNTIDKLQRTLNRDMPEYDFKVNFNKDQENHFPQEDL